MIPHEQIRAESIRVVNQAFLGLLTTVDDQGRPFARWMGSATLAGGLGRIYTLARRTSRKISHLAVHPDVCWVFNSPHCADVVTLYGAAGVVDSPVVISQVWDRLLDCARAYALNPFADDQNLELAAIETIVKRIEFISPRLRIYQPVALEIAAEG